MVMNQFGRVGIELTKEIVDEISNETVRRILKKTRLVKLAEIAVSPIEQDKQQENAGIFVV